MSQNFDVAELVRVAVNDERGGVHLYAALAKTARDALLKDTFARLSDVEKVHQKRFEDMLAGLKKNAAPEQYPDYYADYLEALVTEGESADGGLATRQAAECQNDGDAIALAARFERFQLALLRDMADVLQQREMKIVQEIIREEQTHLVTLAIARRRLEGKR